MKGKDIIKAATRTEMPNMDALREDCIRQAAYKATPTRSIWIKRLVPAVACAVIVVTAVFAVPQFLQNVSDNPQFDVSNSDISQNVSDDPLMDADNSDISQNTPNNPLTDMSNSDIIGLPPAIPGPPCDGPSFSADRIGFHRLQDLLFQFGIPRGFVFARVNEQTPLQSTGHYSLTQTSTLQVLSSVWSDDSEPLPQFMTVQQGFFESDSGITVCCAGSIPLREGGVYFLPLGYDDGGWFIIGSEDVLFEVDDRGKLYSHSQFSDFNRFDGEEANAIADAILLLIEDENFVAATSRFGRNMQWDYEVAVVTYGESAGIQWEVSYNGTVFEQGVSYLTLITTDNTVWDFYATRVNLDGTITPNSDSVFAELYGYTVDEVIAFAERARVWHAG